MVEMASHIQDLVGNGRDTIKRLAKKMLFQVFWSCCCQVVTTCVGDWLRTSKQFW